ncbi:CDP-diacylglycerol--glycerol-3-phosphate 3-phosphatidyltransferase [Galdieria sulphuraria]|uniref:CDP-diacylglycerol--glycerol-3-phosphate 3-phosphatidyltransferase n=1 Tax=Galdieria sulphuraria TaxID=130081 RepID=M2Y7L3_GALSU|nr:CDP-diacylglycerol--glycerol-3-phosphate 3-phosphatidyltransferase [Galdieria sulphuraria]EME32053.1 CDP-diacylglycerol--glycerol-3-phosphate 3-phosphatidyltransferase [Galdieria sulphuraria]|eukprot:XP_005708573.1 CDP-diacylglycerol--glycerol-3-phosphate 3-phosphatidyltransferase [Galdieria sulphuraria]
MESSLQLLAARFRYVSSKVALFSRRLELGTESKRLLLSQWLRKEPTYRWSKQAASNWRSFRPSALERRNIVTSDHNRKEWHIRETLEKQVSDWNIANCITGTRIASIPVIASLIYCQQYEAASMGLAAAGVTDWLDGFLARKYRLSTVLGSYLDPLADKLLINALVFTLSANQLIPFTLALLIFGRDGCLIFGSAYKRWETMKQLGNHSLSDFFHVSRIEPLKIQPLVISKWNTAAQFVLIGYSLFHGMHPGKYLLQI